MRVGLFENPYLDVEETTITVGNENFMKAGYKAQLKSVVLLKNNGKVLPVEKNKTVYIPERTTPPGRDMFGGTTQGSKTSPINLELVKKYFNVTINPAEADFALVIIRSPNAGTGYSADDVKKGGNGYLPISLQYKQYTATEARETSLAGGDPLEKFVNRSYKGKSVTTANESDLKMVTDTRKAMKGKPVIVSVNMAKPMVFSEFEKDANAILATFDIQDQAILDIITGAAEPSGLLPVQMPADMKTVELQNEDVPYDMTCHTDSDGNIYDFGFGLNWSGVIKDARVEKYRKLTK